MNFDAQKKELNKKLENQWEIILKFIHDLEKYHTHSFHNKDMFEMMWWKGLMELKENGGFRQDTFLLDLDFCYKTVGRLRKFYGENTSGLFNAANNAFYACQDCRDIFARLSALEESQSNEPDGR